MLIKNEGREADPEPHVFELVGLGGLRLFGRSNRLCRAYPLTGSLNEVFFRVLSVRNGTREFAFQGLGPYRGLHILDSLCPSGRKE